MTQEHFMALADFQTLWTNTIKPYIAGNFANKNEISYIDVYIGAGKSSAAIIVAANHHDVIKKCEQISITNTDVDYLWVVLPASYSPMVMMGGLEVPMSLDSTTTISEESYKIWKSVNTYSGSFKIYLT